MTVRLTPTESAPPPRPVATTPHPHDAGILPAAESRQELREARRLRRRTAWLCAAIVALCLALTIVAVSLARYRPVGPPAALAASGVPALVTGRTDPVPPAATAAPVADRTASAPVPSRGAPAPEGGNP